MTPQIFTTIGQRVEYAFPPNADTNLVGVYLDRSISQLSRVVDSMKHATTLIVALIALNELFIRALIERLSVAGVEFKDLSLIRKSLPVIIAYLYYDLLRLGAQHQALDRVCKSLAQHQNNHLSQSGVLDWILPQTPSLLGGQPRPLGPPTRWGSFIDKSVTWIAVLALLIVPIFVGYSLVQQFR